MSIQGLKQWLPVGALDLFERFAFGPFLREAHETRQLLERLLREGDARIAEAYRRRKWVALRSEAQCRVPYYRDLLKDLPDEAEVALPRLPTLDKELIRKHSRELTSPAACAHNSFRFNTGGSTGVPLEFVASRSAAFVDRAHQQFLFDISGYSKGDRILAFDGATVPPAARARRVFWVHRTRREIPYGSIHFSSHYFAPATERAYIDEFLRLRPAHLRGYPSFIASFAQCLARHNTSVDFVKSVHLTAENIFDWQVELVRQTLGCKVVRQYGHSEMAVFGFALNGDDEYFVSPFYGITEVLDARGRQVVPGEAGEITVTGLHNTLMPLIRYRTGDQAVYGGEHAGFTVLKRLLGRTQDVLYDGDWQPVPVTGIVFGQHFKAFRNITKWQIVQETPGHANVLIVKGPNYGPEDETEILLRFREGLRIQAHPVYVDNIELTAQGQNEVRREPLDRASSGFMGNRMKKMFAFNSSLCRLWRENAAFAATVPNGAMVLDAGSGDAPFKSLFRHAQYESADSTKVNKTYVPPTYVCDLKSIPVEDCRFDFIVFNQVMEHLPEPQLVLAELHRVLKAGGKMIYTGPLFYEEHEQPYDFYRYTQFGLRHLFGSAGFVIERLDWLEGYFGTAGYQLNCMARYLPWRPSHLGCGLIGYGLAPIMALLKVGCAAWSVVCHRLETRVKFQARGYPKNYVVLASKAR